MSKIELNKIYNSSLIVESDNKWTSFENFPGSEVELFLKDKLEDSVVAFKYYSTGYIAPDTKKVLNNVLVGLNAFGQEVCYERVINADPTYTADFELQRVTIGTTNYNLGDGSLDIQINKSDNLVASATFKYILTGNIAGSTYNETSAQSITFTWFKDALGTDVDATLDTLACVVNPGESVTVDITKMFKNNFSKRFLGVVFKVPNGDTNIIKMFDQSFTLRELKLAYRGDLLIQNESPTNLCKITNIQLEGLGSDDLNSYKLQYYLDNQSRTEFQFKDSSDSITSSNIILPLAKLSEGAHDLFVRVTNTNYTLTSNFIHISFIYQKTLDSLLTSAVAMVTEVPDEISNCNLSKFFKVITSDKISGSVDIVALKDSDRGNLIGIKTIEQAKSAQNQKYLFKEIHMDLLSTDAWKKVDYTSYIEIPGNDTTTLYLRILVKDGTGTRALNYFKPQTGGTASRADYKEFSITNPANGTSHLQATVGEILSFSQIKNGNVFEDLSADLDSSNGILLEEVALGSKTVTLTTFKVSPNKGVFNTPKKLVNAASTPLHEKNFSIELMFKTYGISDLDDPILTIGNITLCPKHLFVNYLIPDIVNDQPHHVVNASRADFRKDAIQHVVITYDPAYKPSTYELLYNKFFKVENVEYTKDAAAFPCLKVYVNGTINRVISIGSSTICSSKDFEFQISPSNSNINFYIFRTYDKTLSFAEVRKNYTSSMPLLEDKRDYYTDNDILYLEEDFSASDRDAKKSIINTISLGKCINNFNSVGKPSIYKDRKVLLLVLPEGVLPPYYGNRKADESPATFLVHYPNDSTHSGRLSPQSIADGKGVVKAQGTSAKKYMFHNTSYSKFKFTPEYVIKEPEKYSDYRPVKYYQMPGSDVKIEKLVGKVNYASSMQSHKLGSCKLFHDGYMQSGIDNNWMNGGRKAVLEDEFFYFFVNVPIEDLETITWDYFLLEDGITYNFENCYFLGFQTWGSAKGDEPTSGYSKATPHYLMLEGADNDNPVANFKTPWASMQIWGNYDNGVWSSANNVFIEPPGTLTNGKNYYHQFSGGTKSSQTGFYTPDYQTGLLIKDETLVFDPGIVPPSTSDKTADALDVDFGCTEGDGYYEKGKWYLDGEEVAKGTPGATQAKDDNLFFVFEDKAVESVNKFATFYNLVYTFDFSSLVLIPYGTTINGKEMTMKTPNGELVPLANNLTGKDVYLYKLIFGANCAIDYGKGPVSVKAGDIYRWEKQWPDTITTDSTNQWVPAGLYYNTKDNNWESLNITDICNWYSNAAIGIGSFPQEYSFFSKEEYAPLKASSSEGYIHIKQDGWRFEGYDQALEELRQMQACMAEAFKITVHEFMDVLDIAYHQAFIKLVAGTDNRAKNTYFQIVGPIYTNKYTSSEHGEVSIIKATVKDGEGNNKKLNGYVKGNQIYEVTIDGETVTETGEIFDATGVEVKDDYYKKTGLGDFKIRLYQDDLDTIFKTDNNGQLVKPYYLLEPPYNKDLEHLWGDMHSGLFYNYDAVFEEDVKAQLGKLLTFATGTDWPDTLGTKFNDYFFSILKNIPSIAYNHQSEIYYESSQTLYQNGAVTPFYTEIANVGGSSWRDFNNNKVQDPVSLSHGSCLEAEVEYLRDRILLLSTYTKTGKSKTDTSIKLAGGSALSAGSLANIQTTYTSFIQYIYPLINNINAADNVPMVTYDSILDYIHYDSSINDYQKCDLVWDMSVPNSATDLNVSFVVSSLTSEYYWTSTDLYRTVWINEGTGLFTTLFNFPNANTAICQKADYKIESKENAEIKVVDYLQNVKHLVLQNAKINTSSLNFTGCNQLTTLVLGETANTLTDSPEDLPTNLKEWYAVKFEDVLDESTSLKLQASEASTGFGLIILPKSNSVEQVILPNCVKAININYYPKLTRFEFNNGTLLTNLTIDGRNNNSIIEYIINSFVGSYTTNLEITNIPDNFWLSEDTCRKLTLVAKVKIEGTVYIGDGSTQTPIKWSTKKLLVEKFGNIETGVTKFKYKVVPAENKQLIYNAQGSMESKSGPAPIVLDMDWNDIPMDFTRGNYLKITYEIKTKDGGTVNADDIRLENNYVPYLTIREGLEGIYKLITKVYVSTSSLPRTAETLITIGFYLPKPGDFAYANGTFSQAYDESLGLVGVVFYSKQISSINGKETYDVRVLSAEASSTSYPLGPATYAVDNADYNYGNMARTYQQLYYQGLLEKLNLPVTEFTDDVHPEDRTGGIANGTIKYNSNVSGGSTNLHESTLSNTEEHSIQMNYIRRANRYLASLPSYVNVDNYIELNDFTKPTELGYLNFEKVLTQLSDLDGISFDGGSYSKLECGNLYYAIYPAFLKALYYQPFTPKGNEAQEYSLSDKGITYFSRGNWYVPDTRELEKLIYYRINSNISSDVNSELAWNKTGASKIEVQKGHGIFKDAAFDNIAFLKDQGPQITSVGVSGGIGYAYYVGDNSSIPSWHSSEGTWETNCGRDINHNIYPVCRIVLTKEN